MQSLGFVYALMPWILLAGDDREEIRRRLERHLQPFNTHPYLTAPVLGAVLYVEVGLVPHHNDEMTVVGLKNALMGPYAAIGDSFFWGALRPFTSIVAVSLAIMGSLIAPLIMLLLYNPLHLWVRYRGYHEGYLRGPLGSGFIAALDLPRRTRLIRWGSLFFLAAAAALIPEGVDRQMPLAMNFGTKLALFLFMLLSFWGIKKGLSPLLILYGTFVIILLTFLLLMGV